jgi:Protein of unknown function (DUF2971)
MSKIEINDEEVRKLDDKFFSHIIGKITLEPELYYKQEATDLVFHYTNLSALIGIIENQCLWATSLHSLNDRNEYKHGIDIVKEAIESIRTEENKSILHAISVVLNQDSEVDRYVVCLSKNGDSLSQWRAYGNNGSGISIGFNREKLEAALLGKNSYRYIIYDKEKQIAAVKLILHETVKFFFPIKDNYSWPNESYYYWLVGYSVSNVLSFIIANYKDPAFEEEREYRIECKQFHNRLNTKTERLTIYHRTNEKLIIPYTKICTKPFEEREIEDYKSLPLSFRVTKLPIERIIIGPSSNQEEVIKGVKQLLQNNFYSTSILADTEIVKSVITYRT